MTHRVSRGRSFASAAAAGHDGVEPWPAEIAPHVEGGGTLADDRKQLPQVVARAVLEKSRSVLNEAPSP